MSDKSKENIDDLLNGYVDGELSERKYTELKRMLLHDPELAARVSQLKKQKQLLNSLPIEKAPQGLLDDVVSSLERKLILHEYSAASIESEGIKHLMFRRALTAAVIMVLFGGLGGLIFKIVSPVHPTNNNEVAVADEVYEVDFTGGTTRLADKPEAIASDRPVFIAKLNLETEHAITMNSFIKKLIFTHNLNDSVDPPENYGTSSTVRFECGIDSIVELLADFQVEWGRCKQANLSVFDHVVKKMIVIENISQSQLMEIFTEDKFYTRMQKAKEYEISNRQTSYSNTMLASNENIAEPYTASGNKSKNRLEGGERISLVITVTGL